MTYRSEEQGRRATIEELEHDLAESRREVEALRKKLARAEEKAAVFRKLVDGRSDADAAARWQRVRWIFAAGLGPAALLWVTAASLAALGSDKTAWTLVNVALVIGIVAPVPAWFRAGHPSMSVLATGAKLGLWLQLGAGWWSMSYARLHVLDPGAASRFFWMFPPAVFLIGLIEALTARWSIHHDTTA